jgi:DNA-binding transcriptional MerR regulator
MMDTCLLSTTELADLVDVPYPTLARWAKQGIITSAQEANGPGTVRLFDFRGAVEAQLAANLRRQRVSLGQISQAIGTLRQKWPDGQRLPEPSTLFILGMDDFAVHFRSLAEQVQDQVENLALCTA